ncbi:MAG: sugar ABC transporter substrate-binding protein [Actinobacteria bacterium]|nr:sugar ABC transporter substrate-binding protein [Actinomycetota bacterium]
MVTGFSLVGCKTTTAVETTEAVTTTAAAETTAAATTTAKEHVTLQFTGWEASPLETESVTKGLDLFMSKNPDITVEYNPIPGAGYNSKILTMMAGGTCPDVFFCYSWGYREFAKAGALLNVTDSFNKEYKIDDFIPSAATIMQVDGGIYGVNSCTVSPVLFYNKDLFDKAGLPYPPSDPAKAWTWDEFREVAKKLTIVEGGKTKQWGVFGQEQTYMASALIMENGGSLFNADVSKCTINSPEAAEVWQAILDVRKVDGSSPEAAPQAASGGAILSSANMLSTGTIAMLIDGSWSLQELSHMDFKVGVGVLPKFTEALTHGQAHVHAAWAQTTHPLEAWRLLSFLSSEEYQIGLIKAGLWMPNRKSLYTEEGIAKWYDPAVHPEGFKEMAPYFQNALVEPTSMNSKVIVNDIITEEIDKFLHGNQPIDVTLANIEQRANVELAKS